MIFAHLDGQVLVVKVSGTLPEFSRDLHDLRLMFAPGDICFDDLKKCWIVSNLDKYAANKLVQVAKKAASLQLSLFEELNMAVDPKTQEAVKKVKDSLEEGGVPPATSMVNAALIMQDILRVSGSSEAEVEQTMGSAYRGD